jgi:cell division septation protein DedD
MTKTELIVKFSNLIGVSDTDAKMSFELLLKRLSANLKSNQLMHIPEFGYFYLIKGKIKKPVSKFDDNNYFEELLDIILYSDEKKLSQSEANGFVFNIPSNNNEDYHPIDSFFSLSIGKPLIPLKGVSTDKSYTPKSGYEYRRLLETKVEEIISRSNISISEEMLPTLIIDARSYNSNQISLERDEVNLDSMLADLDVPTDKIDDPNESNIVKNIAWDFGEDLSKKISAESILDLTDERINSLSNEKKDEIEFKKDLTIPIDEENILDRLLEKEEEKEEVFKNKSPDSKPTVDEIVKESDLPPTPDKVELSVDEKLLKDLKDLEKDKSEIVVNKSLDEEISDEEFWKTASQYFETYYPHDLKPVFENDIEEDDSILSHPDEFLSKGEKIKLGTEKINAVQLESENSDESDVESSILNEKIEIPSKSKGTKWAIIFLPMIIILVAILYYWYSQNAIKSMSENKASEKSLNTDNANIIERDYKIPVTYPYLPENTNIDSNKVKEGAKDIKEKPVTKLENQDQNVKKSLETQTNLKSNNKSEAPIGTPISVGNNIYKYGEIYVVQVASFRSSSIAENEAGRYRNKGYNSFVEPVEISGRGLWYRIKVGNFSSIEEAKNYISKNIR